MDVLLIIVIMCCDLRCCHINPPLLVFIGTGLSAGWDPPAGQPAVPHQPRRQPGFCWCPEEPGLQRSQQQAGGPALWRNRQGLTALKGHGLH